MAGQIRRKRKPEHQLVPSLRLESEVRDAEEQKPDDRRRRPVRVLDERVLLRAGDDTAMARRPIRTAQPRVRRADRTTDDDEDESKQDRDEEQAPLGTIGELHRKTILARP